jgi:hypothetical protein
MGRFIVTIPFSTYFAFAKDFVPLHLQNTSKMGWLLSYSHRLILRRVAESPDTQQS